MPELRVGYVRVCILFLLHAFEAMHRHLITLQSSSLRCGVSVQAKISSKSVTWMARHVLTARTAGSSSKTDTSQTFRACLAHGHLLTSRRDTSMISRVLSKLFAVSKKKKEKKGGGIGSRHVGSRVLRESKCMVGREDWEASKNNTSLVLNSYGLASAVFSAKESINKAFFSFSHDVHTLHM